MAELATFTSNSFTSFEIPTDSRIIECPQCSHLFLHIVIIKYEGSGREQIECPRCCGLLDLVVATVLKKEPGKEK